jgi:hypothetical protein
MDTTLNTYWKAYLSRKPLGSVPGRSLEGWTQTILDIDVKICLFFLFMNL